MNRVTPILLKVDWRVTMPSTLKGNADGYDFQVVLHRSQETKGAAMLQLLPAIPDTNQDRVFLLPDAMVKMADRQVGINGKECGRLKKVRIAVEPGVQDSWALQSHVDMVKADDIFIAADGLSWADLVGEGEQDGEGG